MIFVSLNIYKMRDAPVDRFISRFSLALAAKGSLFSFTSALSLLRARFSHLPPRMRFCSFNRTMYLAIVVAGESEQCISDD